MIFFVNLRKTEQDASKGLLQTEEQQEETTVKIDKKSTRIGICRQVSKYLIIRFWAKISLDLN